MTTPPPAAALAAKCATLSTLATHCHMEINRAISTQRVVLHPIYGKTADGLTLAARALEVLVEAMGTLKAYGAERRSCDECELVMDSALARAAAIVEEVSDGEA